jgi:anti-anti-sigma factor
MSGPGQPPAESYDPLMNFRPMACDWDVVTCTLYVSGVADEVAADRLREAIAEASQDYTQKLTLDLAECDFLPSISIGVIVGAMHNATEHGSEIALVAAPGTIAERVLTIVGLPHATRDPSSADL